MSVVNAAVAEKTDGGVGLPELETVRSSHYVPEQVRRQDRQAGGGDVLPSSTVLPESLTPWHGCFLGNSLGKISSQKKKLHTILLMEGWPL